MSQFERLVPYVLNLELLAETKLTVLSHNSSQPDSEKEVGFWKFFNELVGEGSSRIVIEDRSSFSLSLNIVKGENRYSVKDSIWTDILKICLELNQKDVDIRNCWWLYVEDDHVKADPSAGILHIFFLFEGTKVVKERVVLSDTPPTLLIVDDDDYFFNDADYRAARVRAAYRRFYTKTPFGRLHALKNRTEMESDCFGRSLDLVDEQSGFITRFNTALILREVRKIRWLAVMILLILILLLLK